MATLETLPAPLLAHCSGVVLHVEDFPDEETLLEMECENPFDLLGLYRGIDLTAKSLSHNPEDVDHVFLYRRPLLEYWCETGEDLADIIRHVMIHEIGHHFGFSDDDMERLEASV